MALHHIFSVTTSIFILLTHITSAAITPNATLLSDVNLIEFALNLEYLEAEFFLFGGLGHGLDFVAPDLGEGGPPPIGGKLAKISDKVIGQAIIQFGVEEVGHLRAIKNTVKGFPRPLIDISPSTFAKLMDKAFGRPLHPPFDPYANEINFLIASYVIPYIGLTGYVGTNPLLQNPTLRKLVAGLLGVESGQDAIIRALLYERRKLKVKPYEVSVQEFTDRISTLRDKLGNNGVKDEGFHDILFGNILTGDKYSLSYSRSPQEILRILYGSGNERIPGGFFPKGGYGRIAKSYLQKA